VRLVRAGLDEGTPSMSITWKPGSSPVAHAAARACARAAAIRDRPAWSTAANARQAVGTDATVPNSSGWSASTRRSLMSDLSPAWAGGIEHRPSAKHVNSRAAPAAHPH
jgi:hypothetical protein